MPKTRIAYHGVEPSEALSELIQTRAAQLDELGERVHSTRVVVDGARHHRFEVRVEAHVPGRDLVACEADEDPYQAVRRVFDHLRRQLTAMHERRQAG